MTPIETRLAIFDLSGGSLDKRLNAVFEFCQKFVDIRPQILTGFNIFSYSGSLVVGVQFCFHFPDTQTRQTTLKKLDRTVKLANKSIPMAYITDEAELAKAQDFPLKGDLIFGLTDTRFLEFAIQVLRQKLTESKKIRMSTLK